MPKYTAPIEDIQFILHDWLNITQHYSDIGYDNAADKELVNAIVEEAGKFSTEILSPINSSGDEEGCLLKDGVVTAPKGFKEAYQQFCEAGWAALSGSEEYGGQGLPYSLSVVCAEMNCSANTSWSMYPGLTHGAISALKHHATDELKKAYLPKLNSGEWTGTMCLTESHCGSDLGLIKTKATQNANGSYNITGSKIFISAGEHDMSDNIIHLVLARLEGAPQGTGGISLFLVPKILDADANSTTDNQVTCSSIEHKMGINGSATCVINFDDSKGYLIGEENKGLSCMFTMMNKARLATGVQGYAISELSYQGALEYAHDRVQMRSLSGAKAPDKAADPIVVHPDVKRMLLTQKAFVEGCRGLAYYVSTLVDKVEKSQEKDSVDSRRLDLLTPICKAFMSEAGFEAANHGVQVYGGHGYISEWGMEQMVRDARIAQIYEGTNGIQALDFLGRKILRDKGAALTEWLQEIAGFAATIDGEFEPQAKLLQKLAGDCGQLAQGIGMKAMGNPDEVGAAAFDFLMFSGYLAVGYILLQQVKATENSEQSESFKKSKKQVLSFYFARILPRTSTHKLVIQSGNDVLQNEDFILE